MVAIALVLPVILLLMLFGLDAFENFLFPPTSAPPPGTTPRSNSPLNIGPTAGLSVVDADTDAQLEPAPWVNSEFPVPAAEPCDP
ncbi:hypothetical protein [Streptomyces sp. NPDC001492]